MKKPLKELVLRKVVGTDPAAYVNFFINIFREYFYIFLGTFQGFSFQGTPLSGCFHNERNNSKIPQKGCRGNLYKFRGKRLGRMQILVTV